MRSIDTRFWPPLQASELTVERIRSMAAEDVSCCGDGPAAARVEAIFLEELHGFDGSLRAFGLETAEYQINRGTYVLNYGIRFGNDLPVFARRSCLHKDC